MIKNVFISRSCIHDIGDVQSVQKLAKVLEKQGYTLLLVDSSELPQGTAASSPIQSSKDVSMKEPAK